MKDIGAKMMNKSELIERVAELTGMTREEATRAVNAILEEISQTLSQGGSVNLLGFGKFSAIRQAARMGRNPKTGEEIEIRAKFRPKFQAGKVLRDAVQLSSGAHGTGGGKKE